MNTIKDFHSFGKHLIEYFDNHDCHYVYVSIGSKFNEQDVEFMYPKKKQPTNALSQMIPNFTYPLSYEKDTLLLVIDDFHNNESLIKNQNKLQHISNDFPHMKIFLVDYLITLQNIDLLIHTLTESICQKIDPNQFILCNYICFKSPNVQDNQLETQIPPKIHTLLKKNQGGRYSKCFYQWYGYSYYTYHYIYNYESYHHIHMLHLRPIFYILEKVLTDCLNDFNIDLVDLYIKRYTQNSEKWNKFKQYSICIA